MLPGNEEYCGSIKTQTWKDVILLSQFFTIILPTLGEEYISEGWPGTPQLDVMLTACRLAFLLSVCLAATENDDRTIDGLGTIIGLPVGAGVGGAGGAAGGALTGLIGGAALGNALLNNPILGGLLGVGPGTLLGGIGGTGVGAGIQRQALKWHVHAA